MLASSPTASAATATCAGGGTGHIEGCDQDELEWAIQKLLNEVETGQRYPFKTGPPQPLKR